jgi:SAM-dependent methyltransferase
VKRGHFEAFRPICPRCRAGGRGEHALELQPGAEVDGDLVDGAMVCRVDVCQFEYPILRGIPFLVADVGDHVARHAAELRAGDDLSDFAESVIGDCVGSDHEMNRNRMYLSSYGRSHWEDGGGAVPVIEAALALAGEVRGRWIDLGCSLGRGACEIAARTGALALGVDLSVAMLRAARRVVLTGEVRLPFRKVGVVHERRSWRVEPRPAVDFWYADVTALPFAGGTFDGALSLNTLDSVQWPLAHLHELARVLAPDGRGVLATPYDWTSAVTPIEGWLGGHSQRGRLGGSSAGELRRILAKDGRPGGAPELYIDAEQDGVRWRVPMHERAEVEYTLDMVRVRR